MDLVEALGIDAIVLAHTLGDVSVWGFHQQMVVIAHLAVGVDDPVEAFADLAQNVQPQFLVFVFDIYIVPPVPARGNPVQGASKLYA